MAGIYVHIPFCRQACHYCDFHFSTNQHLVNNVVKAICSEITSNNNFFDEVTRIETIYFGGGTPSLLKPSHLGSILNVINNTFDIDASAEVTLEANPEDISAAILSDWLMLGVNRLSIGVQSFNDQVLQWMNRVHDGQTAERSVLDSTTAGFENVNVDLIYGVSLRDRSDWENEIARLLDLDPKHISAYCLTIEEKTAFGKWLKADKMAPVNQDLAAEEYSVFIDRITQKGFEQYEVSNFSKPGFESRHNSSYWERKPFLGVGPAAHSFKNAERRINISNNAKYVDLINKGEDHFNTEYLNQKNQINEFIMTSLRTSKGLSFQHLKKVYAYDILKHKKPYLQSIVGQNLGSINNSEFKLNSQGLLFADEIILELIL